MTGAAELLSPAGDFDTALAAFAAGADAVYCGLADFSARAFAKNLTESELTDLVAYARRHDRRVYVTFNTIIDEDRLEDAVSRLARLEEIGPDALIVQDLGVARLCRRYFPGLRLHASTQLVAHNLEGVLSLAELGFTRVVLARELSLAEVASIAKRCRGMELECFIHGALCYSISGLCLFSAMEKGRSGNRGKCAYCCRLPYADESGRSTLAFSMKDLRLAEDVRKLVDAGVKSLKVEGRMKSAVYVASVTKYYRQILDDLTGAGAVTRADLETVFSRRTTELYLNGKPSESVIDPDSLGHLGAAIGTIKRVTADREGREWIRLHTSRALEKHDGLQFENPDGGKPLGMGIVEMRQAISRQPVFEVAAGTDVEILKPESLQLKSGMTVYCSMSNAVKRKFPVPSFRPSDYEGGTAVDVEVTLRADGISATGVETKCVLDAAKNPEKTYAAVEKAFSKLGGTGYRLGKLKLIDAERRFAPMSALNELRRRLVEKLDAERSVARQAKIERALESEMPPPKSAKSLKTVKVRAGQKVPAGEWDEVIVVMGEGGDRVALPVYTSELEYNRLRVAVKGLIRKGCRKWEVADLAGLRLIKSLGIDDITADWSLYAFNSAALATLAELGVRRFVASPENSRENLQYLAESGYDVEFLVQQSTPLFISLTEPKPQTELAVFRSDGLYVTTRPEPRTFAAPEGASTRIDLSWDPD